MLSVLIADRNTGDLSTLKSILNTQCRALVKHCATATNPADVFGKINRKNFDLAFLDICYGNGTEGLSLARHLRGKGTKVVFVTKHEQYALDAYQLRVYHYMLKPIDPGLVRQLVMELANQKLMSNSGRFQLRVNSADGLLMIREEDIIRIEGDGSYSHIYCCNQAPILVSRHLGKLMKELKSKFFLRTHQSHLINLQQVRRYLQNQLVELRDGSKVPVSRRRKDALLARL